MQSESNVTAAATNRQPIKAPVAVDKPIVYIASAYTKGDPCINVHISMKAAAKMLDEGVVYPYSPLLTHFWHTSMPRPYESWISYDLGLLRVFDACLRLVGDSRGADGEVAWFDAHGVPVFYARAWDDHAAYALLYDWAKDWMAPERAVRGPHALPPRRIP